MFCLTQGALDTSALFSQWFEAHRGLNLGAFSSFCGIVRAEDGIEALSFDVYESLLKAWFENWCEQVKHEDARLCFAHSLGEVRVHQSSFLAGVFSPHRKLSLRLINDFVEDFKKNAPIWKYDVIKGERIFAKERSHKLAGAGLLS